MTNNFVFLESKFPLMANLGHLAESYLYTDTNSCLIKLGQFGETLVKQMFVLDGITAPDFDNTHANRIRVLKREGLVPKDIDDILYALRIARNKAVHDSYDSFEECKTLLQMTFHLAVWFMQTYGDWAFVPGEFFMPDDQSQQIDFEALLQQKEATIETLSQQIQAATTHNTISTAERIQRSNNAMSHIKLSEKETRYLIDEQLRKVGWEADSIGLRYSKGTRPVKGRNLAIAEWPTDSRVGHAGAADYALFIGLQLVGIIEAKADHKDIPAIIDYQCKEYPKNIKAEHLEYQIGIWGEYKVPFSFATNGRPYLKQLETKSGIWFLDLRAPSNIPKALQGWMSPEGMLELLEKDIASANQSLQQTPFDLLRDKDGLNLRDYQIRAIEAAEGAIIDGNQTALLSMATGTGKTRTILGMIYRFLKTDRFKRILFLVDRTALGEQAQDVFREVKLEDLMTLDEIYNINSLEDQQIHRETRIQVATVQSMVKRILYNEEESMPAVTDYDLIIIDEAHRGYILDKDMGDLELDYRNQTDFVSKYRAVIDYFDAVKIALTATPALHTTEIFGKPVFNYSYREAVIEGYLVDHDAPHEIHTKLRDEGISYKQGETLAIYDPITGEITNSDELTDEVSFDIEKFNRQVITESFNRTVLTEIAQNIDPESDGKTLIYAVDDQHADLIVQILKEIYSDYGVDNDAVMKITGSVGGGNKKKVLEAIKRFKNERYPNIAVTVDLLTTGIDVPEINTLVFMRRVKSRILFEQMLGRATRLCTKIQKTHFEIYDPIGVYEALDDVSTMKPVSANPAATFDDLLNGLDVADSADQMRYQVDLILTKLQRKKSKLSSKALEQFADLTGGMQPAAFMQQVREMPPEQAREHLLRSRELFAVLNEGGMNPARTMVISDKEDALISHTRGYGSGKRPEDYLDEFAAFVKNNVNEIAALNIVCTRPKELTRDSLKSLKLALDREGYTEQQLNTAIGELTNEAIAADIISIIRRYALGSSLLSHEARIKRAVDKLRHAHSFSKQEQNWIGRMESYLLNESVLNVQTFDEGAFKDNGGFNRIDKIFRNQLKDIVLELNEYLYDDGGHPA